MTENLLEKKLIETLPDYDDNVIRKLAEFGNLVLEANQKINLTAITDVGEFAIKHIADSLTACPYIKDANTVADIGTGAGFPGVPLAILFPDKKFTLVESIGKKCAFIDEALKKMQISNVQVVNERAEAIANGKLREQFDIVTARAVAELNVLCEYCLPLVKVGGRFIAYKSISAQDEMQKAKIAIGQLGGRQEKIQSVALDGKNTRNLIIINKEKSTPSRFPRLANKIKSNPL